MILRRTSGFTLIEMLTVLVIIGILTTIGLVGIQHIGSATALGAASRQFADHIMMARTYALVNGADVYLVVPISSTMNTVGFPYQTYGLCVPPNKTDDPYATGVANCQYIDKIQFLPLGVVFASTTRNVAVRSISFPTQSSPAVPVWVVTLNKDGNVLPLSKIPSFFMFKGRVDPTSLKPVSTGAGTNEIAIGTLLGKPRIRKG